MLTFLPYPDYDESAQALDYKRLGRQRVEARQLLETTGWRLERELGVPHTNLRDDLPDKGPWVEKWRAGPASKMWQGHHWSLARYYNAMVREWRRRGYSNNMPLIRLEAEALDDPPWLGDKEFHSAQRANLIRKNPSYYKDMLGWTEEPLDGYIWPVR